MAPFGASRAGLMSVAGDDIPDEGLLHEHDAREISDVDTWPDIAGDNDLSVDLGSPSVISDAINGQQAVEYDDDSHSGDGFVGGDNDEYTLAFVLKPLSTSGDQRVIDNDLSPRAAVELSDGGVWGAVHPGVAKNTGGSYQVDEVYAGVQTYDGSNVILQVGNDVIINESVGTDSESDNYGFGAGVGGTSDREANVQLGHGLSYDQFYDGSQRDDIITALESSWGFTTPDVE